MPSVYPLTMYGGSGALLPASAIPCARVCCWNVSEARYAYGKSCRSRWSQRLPTPMKSSNAKMRARYGFSMFMTIPASSFFPRVDGHLVSRVDIYLPPHDAEGLCERFHHGKHRPAVQLAALDGGLHGKVPPRSLHFEDFKAR